MSQQYPESWMAELDRKDEPKSCFCVGPQNGDPACPCAMRGLRQKPLPQQSGFFDITTKPGCMREDHSPPSHIFIPAGKGYRHVCPGCGKVQVMFSSSVTMEASSC